MARRKQKLIYHGETLDYYILDNISRFGIMFHKLYPKILNSYGSVSGRTIHRRLIKLRLENKILKIMESRSLVYYRLLKTVKK